MQIEELNVRCKYLSQCPRVRELLKMRDNEKLTITYLNNADGYYELCLSASPEPCLTYQDFERDFIKQLKEMDIGF